ncbi:hypothetical protein HBI06_082890 [Parastagonospora nodorum]|nr:hypothetical protein HBI06_082890 [Parastagonospora nodorum]KAH4245254.1 hypothetical protein HBI05_066030 [Parastagonospora nodorum]
MSETLTSKSDVYAPVPPELQAEIERYQSRLYNITEVRYDARIRRQRAINQRCAEFRKASGPILRRAERIIAGLPAEEGQASGQAQNIAVDQAPSIKHSRARDPDHIPRCVSSRTQRSSCRDPETQGRASPSRSTRRRPEGRQRGLEGRERDLDHRALRKRRSLSSLGHQVDDPRERATYCGKTSRAKQSTN